MFEGLDIGSGIIGSAITSIVALLVWYLKEKGKINIFRKKSLVELEIEKLQNESHGERFIFNKHIKQKLDELRSTFGERATSIFLCKFHNGEYYTDYTHIMKWSVFIESYREGCSLKDKLQNRLTTDTPHFFGDLKEHKTSIANDVDKINCDGWRVLMKYLKMKSYVAAIQESKKDVKAFVCVMFDETQDLKQDDATLLVQGLNSIAEYI